MNRREMLGVGAGALLIPASIALAADDPHAAHGGDGNPLVDATLRCTTAGELCVEHCFTVIAEGDSSLVGCARSVHEMLAMNAAVLRLAAGRSAQLKGVAQAAIAVYRACEQECRKHEKKHAVCGHCADACVATVNAIQQG